MEPADFVLNYFYKILEWDIYKYLIPEKRLPPAEIDRKLESCSQVFHDRASRCIGYQLDSDIKHTAGLEKFLDVHINNIGDPNQKGSYLLNSKEIEYAVIRYYAGLWNARMRNMDLDADPHDNSHQDPDVYWGYVLSMGSSEGNIMAAWMGRDYVGGKYLIVDSEKSKVVPKVGRIISQLKGEKPIDILQPTVFFASAAAHYSVLKAAVLMNLPGFGEYGNQHYAGAEIPGVKKADEPFPDHVPVYNDLDGRVDPDKLAALVEYFAARRHGIMVVLNYGTTFTGAFDELEVCINRLKKIFAKYGLDEVVREVQKPGSKEVITDTRTGYWIHVDGAYGGCYMPYLAKHFKNNPDQVVDTVIDLNGNKVEYKASQIPTLDMTKFPEICSTVTSGHKFPGAPWPLGVYMSRHKYQLHPPSSPMYIGSMDSTLSGSRNGLSAIVLWKYLSLNSDEQIIDNCVRCLKTIQEIEVRFRKIIEKKNKEKGLDLRLIRGPFGLTLIFSKMREAIRSKYTLAQQSMEDYDYNHLFTFTNVANKPEVINSFLKDAEEDYSFEAELIGLEVTKIPGGALGEVEKKKNKLRKYQMGPGNC